MPKLPLKRKLDYYKNCLTYDHYSDKIECSFVIEDY